MKLHLPLAAALAVVLGARIEAQFPGDLFFANPNPIVREGEPVVLELALFTGSDPFGAASFRLTYDPARLSVVGAEISGEAGSDTVYSSPGTSGTALIVTNDSSLSKPSGTTRIALVTVLPLVPAGNSVQVGIAPRAVLRASGVGFANPRGFSATITVVEAAAAIRAELLPARCVPYELFAGGVPLSGSAPLRDLGGEALLWEAVDTASGPVWMRRPVRSFDPAAPRDGRVARPGG